MDLLQAAHTWSGIEMALWDVVGKKRNAPVYELLRLQEGLSQAALASQLFGDTPAGDAGRLPLGARAGLSRGEMRLGSVRPRQSRS